MALTWRTPLLLLISVAAVLVRPEKGTVWTILGLVILLVLLDWWWAPKVSTLQLSRYRTPATRLGEVTETALVVENTGNRRVVGVLRDAWQPSAGAHPNRHPLRLPARERTRLVTPLDPVRRGELATDRVTVRMTGPLGLAARQASALVPGDVRVTPAFPSRRHLPSRLARLRELDGRAAVRVRGQGTEFDSLREYVRGDDVRSIDWRASARSRNVVVRTWQPERDRRVVIVLDTSRTSAGRIGDVPRLDSAMDAALLLAALAARAGDRVDFLAGDRMVRARVRSGHRGDALSGVQDAMVGLGSELVEADWRRLVGAVDDLGRSRALVVLLTPLEPSAIEHGLLPLVGHLSARHRVVLASVRDPELTRLAADREDLTSTYQAAAAEQTIARRQRTAALLEALHVDVLDESADQLPVVLADHYLSLKARGVL
ncbi:DUF58 domain-containing protein [Nocardioides marmorisolisilvae]|uniref:DUF58 domain-containing protein n=1 Tax=Nocardioides marmorisolisilvae TaxID=1542737 RepID=A0A3N0DZL0_9ACTN|nr:DUF58 domain-containing protein [Nocardioides marmorisolisilvae]RNL81034.1 DUF58 domain-containing protein [Nocardioides marmorisolisilvae]